MVDIVTEWNLKNVRKTVCFLEVVVDIVTEWNLKFTSVFLFLPFVGVDIVTEWNLKDKAGEDISRSRGG